MKTALPQERYRPIEKFEMPAGTGIGPQGLLRGAGTCAAASSTDPAASGGTRTGTLPSPLITNGFCTLTVFGSAFDALIETPHPGTGLRAHVGGWDRNPSRGYGGRLGSDAGTGGIFAAAASAHAGARGVRYAGGGSGRTRGDVDVPPRVFRLRGRWKFGPINSWRNEGISGRMLIGAGKARY